MFAYIVILLSDGFQQKNVRNMTYHDGDGMPVRDLVLDPEALTYFAVVNGYAPRFQGVWKGQQQAVFAFRNTRTSYDGRTAPTIPVYRVDGKDVNGDPVFVSISTLSGEFDMIGELAEMHGIFDNGDPVSQHHRMMGYEQVVEMCPVNTRAPVFDMETGRIVGNEAVSF